MPEASPLESVLLNALLEKSADGKARFTREQVRDVVALLLLSKPPKLNRPSPQMLQLLGEFSIAVRAALAGAGELQEKLDTYFTKHPPDPELLRRLKAALPKQSP